VSGSKKRKIPQSRDLALFIDLLVSVEEDPPETVYRYKWPTDQPPYSEHRQYDPKWVCRRCGDCCAESPCRIPAPVDVAVLRFLGLGGVAVIHSVDRFIHSFEFLVRNDSRFPDAPERVILPRPKGESWEDGCQFGSFDSEGRHVCALMECEAFRHLRLVYQGEFDCLRSHLWRQPNFCR